MYQEGHDVKVQPVNKEGASGDAFFALPHGKVSAEAVQDEPVQALALEQEEASQQRDLWQGQEEASSFAQASARKTLVLLALEKQISQNTQTLVWAASAG